MNLNITPLASKAFNRLDMKLAATLVGLAATLVFAPACAAENLPDEKRQPGLSDCFGEAGK